MGSEGGVIESKSTISDLSSHDILLTEQAPSDQQKAVEVFFHRIDREGMEDAEERLKSKDRDRLILVPSHVALEPYQLMLERLGKIEQQHPHIASISLMPYLFLIEELSVKTRTKVEMEANIRIIK